MKIENMKPGMVVYDVHRHKMGNTAMSTVGIWSIRVHEVDYSTGRVVASWSGNPAKTFYERTWKKWRLSKPMLVDCGFGRKRLATRAEQKAAETPNDQRKGRMSRPAECAGYVIGEKQ